MHCLSVGGRAAPAERSNAQLYLTELTEALRVGGDLVYLALCLGVRRLFPGAAVRICMITHIDRSLRRTP